MCTIVSNGERGAINPIALKPLMEKKGFNLSTIQEPAGLHISMTIGIANKSKELIQALKQCVKQVKSDPSLNTNETIATYGMTAKIPDANFVTDILRIHSGELLDTL